MRRILLSVILAGCVGGSGVRRTAADSTEGGDLSGYWNDIDAQRVADDMIVQCLGKGWIDDFEAEHQRRPVIKLMGVLKRTDDPQVRTSFFTHQIERALLDSGRVRVVASFGQDLINVVERGRQTLTASVAKAHGRELAPDFTLQTFVHSQNEVRSDDRSVRAYLVRMEMVSVGHNEKVWMGQTRIRKVIDGLPPRCGDGVDTLANNLPPRVRLGLDGDTEKEERERAARVAATALETLRTAAGHSSPEALGRVLDDSAVGVFEYLLVKVARETPATSEAQARRAQDLAFLFGTLCLTSTQPLHACIDAGRSRDPARIKEVLSLGGLRDDAAPVELYRQLEARAAHRRKARHADLRSRDLGRCRSRGRVITRDPNSSENFVRLTMKSRLAKAWQKGLYRLHSALFDCGDELALVLVTEYRDRQDLRVFGWRFVDPAEALDLLALGAWEG